MSKSDNLPDCTDSPLMEHSSDQHKSLSDSTESPLVEQNSDQHKTSSDSTESPSVDDQLNSTKHEEESKQQVKYGELVVLGYNGSLPGGDKDRRGSKFSLYKRPTPNGLKRSGNYAVVNTSRRFEATPANHSISFSTSCDETTVVEYADDEETDMFQIGRSWETPIDFVVDRITGEEKTGKSESEIQYMSNTISRFACRIVVDRADPRVARVYSAGFDSSKTIFLGELATKWGKGGEMDGVTTNGVLMAHPLGPFRGGDSQPGAWQEVSVNGKIFTRRNPRCERFFGTAVEGASNLLRDGTLIDLCGATLLWRSAEGLDGSPTEPHVERLLHRLNATRPVCPVMLNTLVLPLKSTAARDNPARPSELGTLDGDAPALGRPPAVFCDGQRPYVYLRCGHVQGLHNWGLEEAGWPCPLCRVVGPVAKLRMGLEPALYVDSGPTDFYAFSPCGHIATEKTVKYWAAVTIPLRASDPKAICPFCATPLEGHPGYVRLYIS